MSRLEADKHYTYTHHNIDARTYISMFTLQLLVECYKIDAEFENLHCC